jgi:uncharacterized protein YgiM (DUF1202 family)
MDRPRMRNMKRLRAALLAAVIGSSAVVFAGDLYVQPDKLDVREGPGLLFDPVDSVAKNAKLQEIERTDDGWIKVQTPTGKTGYVFKQSVGDKPAPGPGLFSGLGVTSDAEASQMSTGAAAKGLEPEAEKYAANKNYSKASLDKVISMNKAVKGKQWLTFCQDGKVGPSKPKQ